MELRQETTAPTATDETGRGPGMAKTENPVSELLRSYRGQSVVYCPNPGNGGDAIIAEATFRLLDKHGVRYKIYDRDPGSLLPGDHFFFGGGGNLVELYPEGEGVPATVHDRVERFVILPHTISGHGEFLAKLGENTTVFAREPRSYEYVKGFPGIGAVHLDHDLALSLVGDAAFKNEVRRARFRQFGRYVNVLRRKRHARKRGEAVRWNDILCYREDRERTKKEFAWENYDISRIINFDSTMRDREAVRKTVFGILGLLSWFRKIRTDRLHVAISGAILNKQVELSANKYWKNGEIHAHSLRARFPNITFIDRGDNKQ
ncbi:MAG: polysaccharide pyruvyl transferase family protein [Opitutales bacterium]|nr:polysaccharide pyruvyl transferase family protein [Opitutales bacterium]